MGKISGLPSDSAPTATDYIIVNDSETGTTKRVLLSDLASILVPNMALANNPYKFSAYRSAGYTVPATEFVYDTKIYDSNNNYSTATGRYTAPVDGYYFFIGQINHNWTASTGRAIGTQLLINGAQLAVNDFVGTYNGNFGSWAQQEAKMVYLTAGQYVSVTTYGGNGLGAVVGSTNCFFEGFLFAKT